MYEANSKQNKCYMDTCIMFIFSGPVDKEEPSPAAATTEPPPVDNMVEDANTKLVQTDTLGL